MSRYYKILNMKKFLSLFAKINILLGLALMILPIGYLVALNTPTIWYRINPNALEDEVTSLSLQPFESVTTDTTLATKEFTVESQPNPALPDGHHLFISKAGINTQIYEALNERDGLAQGVWRLSKYGTPESNDKPIILAAHRWGDINLSNEFRNQHLFLNLPRLEVGDVITITWDQRVYNYKVILKEETTYVSRLTNLILITCQFINSPERIIVYAERI
jgi:LPXTG-site transpeptidase (sortase) family protein